MAVTEAFSGSATIGVTEYSLSNNSTTLAAQTAVGCYQLFLDLNALVAADEFEVRCYEKVRSVDTQRVVWKAHITGALAAPAWASPALLLLNGWDFTIDKIAGTDRTITWSIRKAA